MHMLNDYDLNIPLQGQFPLIKAHVGHIKTKAPQNIV